MLTERELARYDRQIMIPEIGEKGQERLKGSKVLVAGAGGLGSAVCPYLTAAGVGTIRIVDHDRVSLSNLNRQVLHWQADLGERKADSAVNKLKQLNPDVEPDPVAVTITEKNVMGLTAGMDAIVDAMDNLPARYLLNKAAIEHGIPFFHGAVHGFEGRATTVIPGKTACLRCMHRGSVREEKFPVIGTTPAVIGCIQAMEVIKYIVGIGELLANRFLHFDGLALTFTEFRIKRNPQCDHCGHML